MERATCVGDIDGLITFDASRIPQVAMVVGQHLGATGDEDPVSRLPLVAIFGSDNPTKTRNCFVNPQRIVPILAAEPLDGQGTEFGRVAWSG